MGFAPSSSTDGAFHLNAGKRLYPARQATRRLS